jgi:rhodanese-related sulfurtransferase
MLSPRVPEITIDALPEDAHILDVREPEEWVQGHIEGAQHIPIGQVIARLSEVPQDRSIVVVCKVGGRSAQVTAYLAQRGFQAANLCGGMDAWQDARRRMVSETGAPPYVL